MVRHTKWTIRMLKAEAKKYRTKEAFQKGSRGAYDCASNGGSLGVICSHMADFANWTLPIAKREAKKYQTKEAFSKGSRGAYMFAMGNDHLDEVCEHMTPGPIDMDRLIMNVVRKLR